VQGIRVWIEGYLRGRYGYEGPRAFWVLAVPVLIGAIVLAGWILIGSLLTIPRFSPEGPVVRNGVAAVVVCRKKSGAMNEKGLMAVSDHALEPRTGGWWPDKRGNCTIWYHRPPGLEQRLNRQERAANLSVSGEMPPTEGVRRSESQLERLPVVEKLPVDER
jgi:hypothetical protein